MDRNINDDDRIVIGVREWAIDSIWTKGLGLDRWLIGGEKIPDTKVVLEEANKLEEYVLRGIPQEPRSFMPDKAHINYRETKD